MNSIDPVHSRDLVELVNRTSPADQSRGSCVSIYAPMIRTGREVQQNSIRFRNAINNAEDSLKLNDVDSRTIQRILEPARERLDDPEYWQHQSDGLAVFLAEEFDRWWRLPSHFSEAVKIGPPLYIRPLLKLLTDGRPWYLLAVSPKRVRLLRATLYDVEELDPGNFPKNLQDALNIDEYVSTLQFHSTTRQVNGAHRESAVHHGQGGNDPDVRKQDELLQYFHKLNDALDSYFHEERSPLIFAGVEYLFPIFKEACHYNGLMDEPIRGNPDERSARDLHEESTEIMREEFRRETESVVDQYREKQHSDWASSDPGEIYQAARLGQVETLLVHPDCEWWAATDPNGSIQYFDEPSPEREDLINRLMVDTFRSHGTIVAANKKIMAAKNANEPETGVAALFRSPVGQFVDDVAGPPPGDENR